MKLGTWIDNEEKAYPHGGFTRHGKAVLRENEFVKLALPYGQIVAFRASIPDTYFSIPARFTYKGKQYKAFITSNEDGLEITPERYQ